MTSPNSPSPDVAYVWGEGSSFGQDVTEQSAMTAMRTSPISPWEVAQTSWKQACAEKRSELAVLRDGQLHLSGRMDLLDRVSGYAACVMSHSWNIPHSRWIVLPYDTQLGPSKAVEVSTPNPETGFLTLKRGGLWRLDTHITVSGFAIGLNFYLQNGVPVFYNTYSPVYPRVLIELVDSSGNLISATDGSIVTTLANNAETAAGWLEAPRSLAFSKTFVLPDMPPEDDEGASDHWVKARISIHYVPIYLGVLSSTTCKVHGGTGLSSFSANLWTRESGNLDFDDEVDHGGNLG